MWYLVTTLKLLKWVRNAPLNQDMKTASQIRFLLWQFRSLFIKREIIFEWIGGAKFYVRSGEHSLTGNVYVGLMEFEEMSFLIDFLQPFDLFLDVGANSGSYTILAAKLSQSRVVSYEPSKDSYDRLCKNVSLNAIENLVSVRQKAVGNEDGSISMTSNLDSVNHILGKLDNSYSQNIQMVPLVKLDSDLIEFPIMMKIDVEGFESEVLKGATKLLGNRHLRVLIVELNGSGENYGFIDQSTILFLENFGFEAMRYDPFSRELTSLNVKIKSEGNIIFVRDLGFIQNRLLQERGYDYGIFKKI